MISIENLLILEKKVLPSFFETMYTVTFSFIIATILGFIIALLLVCCNEDGLYSNKTVYKTINILSNILRSFPFIILIVALIPLTRTIVGTSIGKQAAIVPLVVGLAPFIGRLIENSFNEVDKSIIKAATSFCANRRQIIFRVMFKEAIPGIIMNLTLALINTVRLSSMAGVVGGGGLGSTAIIYGYQSFNDFVMYSVVVILVVLVQFIQWIGTTLYKKTVK